MKTPYKVCHERTLPKDQMRAQAVVRRNGIAHAIIVARKMWINGSTLRVRFMGGTAAEQRTARDQSAWWAEHANLKFVFNNDPDAEIRIAFDHSDGAWSYIGTDARQIPINAPTMNLGFLDGGTAAHEFGHAIGLGHEHQNPSGGIQWNEEIVIRDLAGSPNFWDEATARHNVIEKYAANQIRGTAFDPDSIMLYFFPNSWVKSGKGTKANDVLSALDKAFIASAQAYPRLVKPSTEIKVGATASTKAAIGKAGEEDVFQFVANKSGRHSISTGGSTDVVLKLFGPDDPTRLIGEDDDSGPGNNAHLLANLVPGKYLAQVRHYRLTGTGKYTIRVQRN
jgi:hypothetical protein